MTQPASRWTKAPGEHGEDPRAADEEVLDPEHARELTENRPVVNDQEPTGEQGTSSDRPGVDGGGYPEPRPRVDPPTAGPADD
jgi:hypothetical protein